jgi:ribosomal protein S4
MRLITKYKIHQHRTSSDWRLPTRILSFKRPKWAKIKKKLRVKFRRKVWIKGWRYRKLPKYIDHLKIKVRKKFLVKKFSHTKQQSKKYWASLFENSIKPRWDSKCKGRKEVVSTFLIKPLYRIDIILWHLGFIRCGSEARAFINSGFVFVNDKIVGPNYELQKGDVVSFDFSPSFRIWTSHGFIRHTYKRGRLLFPFLEFDRYTNTLCVIKNWDALGKSELACTIKRAWKLKYIDYE